MAVTLSLMCLALLPSIDMDDPWVNPQFSFVVQFSLVFIVNIELNDMSALNAVKK